MTSGTHKRIEKCLSSRTESTSSLFYRNNYQLYVCKKWEYNKDVCQLFIDFEKAYDSIKRESLYDILIKFGVPKN